MDNHLSTPPYESGWLWSSWTCGRHALVVGQFLLAMWRLDCQAQENIQFPDTSNPAAFWTQQTIELVVRYQQNPLRAARALAYVTTALHDAAGVVAEVGSPGDAVVVQHLVGGMTLGYLYPQEGPTKQSAIGTYLAWKYVGADAGAQSRMRSKLQGAAEEIVERVRAKALSDGASRVWNIRDRPQPAPGRWSAAPPLNMYTPQEPMAGRWASWVVSTSKLARVPTPTVYGSAEFWAEAREVLDTHRSLTPAQKAVADRWNLEYGSVTPPGVWNMEALKAIERNRLDPSASALVLSALNVAMIDALVVAWAVKYKHWTARPVTVIREGLDKDFIPYLFTPPHPSFVSGHATVSGAAAEVLSHFFPAEADRLSTMAREAAESRLLGGIHFRSDNEQGLMLGRLVGQHVRERLRRDMDQPRWLSEASAVED